MAGTDAGAMDTDGSDVLGALRSLAPQMRATDLGSLMTELTPAGPRLAVLEVAPRLGEAPGLSPVVPAAVDSRIVSTAYPFSSC